MKIKNKYLDFVLIIIFNLIFFSIALQDFSFFSFFKFIDEIIALIGVLFILLEIIKNGIQIKRFKYILVLSIIVLFYLIYSYVLEIQGLFSIIIDFITLIKFFSSIYFFYYIIKKLQIKYMPNLLVSEVRIIVYIYFLLTIAFYLFNIFPAYEIRYGIKCLRLFYPNYTVFANSLIFLLIFLYKYNNKSIIILLTILSFMIVFTFRSKSIAFLVIFWAFIVIEKLKSKSVQFIILSCALILAIYLSIDKIIFYFIEIDDSARNVLYKTSIQIANSNIFGYGFGSFGSAQSGISYSIVYTIYGIDNIYGLSINNSSFISDTFWPMIIGQFGYPGLIIYILILISLIKKILSAYNKKIKIMMFMSLILLIINSFAESSFVHPMSIMFAFLIGVGFAEDKMQTRI